MELKQLTRKDGFWWLISAFLGSIAWITPNTLNFGLSIGSVVIISILSLFLLGAVIGYLRPVKPWRWALASVLFLPFFEIVRSVFVPPELARESISIISIILFELVKIPVYALIALPTAFGAYIGSYIKGKGGNKEITPKNSTIILPWILGIFLGILVSVIPILFISDYNLPNLAPYWIGGLFIVSILMGIIFPFPEWRWAIAVGIGLQFVVIFKIIIDSVFSSNINHNLFPFEIIISLFIAAFSSLPGVYLGALIKTLIRKIKTT